MGGDLVAAGTSGNDTIIVALASEPAKLAVTINGLFVGDFPSAAITGRVILRGFGGADRLTIGRGVSFGSDLIGGDGNDTLAAGVGNDLLDGGAGNDLLTGGAGDDRFRFADGWGSDRIIEATRGGSDRVDFSAATRGVLFRRGTTITAREGTNRLTAPAIESLIGGSGGDTLVGGASNAWAISGSNAGTLQGTFAFNGIENLTGGIGADTFTLANGAGVAGRLDGAAGANTLSFAAFATPVRIDLDTRTASNVGAF